MIMMIINKAAKQQEAIEKVMSALILLTCVQEISWSNIAQNTGYLFLEA
jgi:hypothetical protein